jgi:hypothetical protein
MAKKNQYSMEWQKSSECSKSRYENEVEKFFSEDPEDQLDAKSICGLCPVRRECLSWALDNKEIWGTWGGRDQEEIRDTLSISEEGQEVRKVRDGNSPVCLYCDAGTEHLTTGEEDIPGGGRWNTRKIVTCTKCQFSWTSRTSSNAVEAYFSLQDKINLRKER